MMSTGCGPTDKLVDQSDVDKLNLLEKSNYYGHPNLKRAEKDPRQCIWHRTSDPSGGGYTAPILKLLSSTNGIVEFESDAFDGQMRGNLILSKYQGGLYRVILSPDGRSVVPSSNPAISLAGGIGFALTQAPNGNLIDARYVKSEVYCYKPKESVTNNLVVKSVFPRRGGLPGGSKLMVFGENFSAGATVTVGGKACTGVNVVSSQKLECTIPMAPTVGAVDIVVTVGGSSDGFLKGYRYITGMPKS
jgi:IPT/TIG domain